MPATKTKSIKKQSTKKRTSVLDNFSHLGNVLKGKKRIVSNSRLILLGFLVILIFLLGYRFKGLIMVATVNGQPIYSWQFAKKLYQQQGPAVLDNLVLETLLKQTARESQITITEQDLEAEINRFQEEIGGAKALTAMIAQQGLNQESFRDGIRLQLIIEKLLEKEVTITDQQIDAFIKQYELQMEATTEADLREEAREILRSQEMSEAYTNLFPELKEKANIDQFLKF